MKKIGVRGLCEGGRACKKEREKERKREKQKIKILRYHILMINMSLWGWWSYEFPKVHRIFSVSFFFFISPAPRAVRVHLQYGGTPSKGLPELQRITTTTATAAATTLVLLLQLLLVLLGLSG